MHNTLQCAKIISILIFEEIESAWFEEQTAQVSINFRWLKLFLFLIEVFLARSAGGGYECRVPQA
jgi:hypothetical protein